MFEYIKIGNILKPHRYEGVLLSEIEAAVFDDLLNCQAVFIRINGLEVPFFLEHMDLHESGSFLKLEEFNSPEDIKPFNNATLYLRSEDLSTVNTQNFSKKEKNLAGFTILDKSSGKKFLIQRTEEYPQQWMAIVTLGTDELLIPLTEEWILSIDEEKKEIRMDLPDGLIDF